MLITMGNQTMSHPDEPAPSHPVLPLRPFPCTECGHTIGHLRRLHSQSGHYDVLVRAITLSNGDIRCEIIMGRAQLVCLECGSVVEWYYGVAHWQEFESVAETENSKT